MAILRNIDKFFSWSPEGRRFLPHYWRREILPSWMYFDLSQVQGSLTLPGLAAAQPQVYRQPYSSVERLDQDLGTPFEVRSCVFADLTEGSAAAEFTVELQELGELRKFMNRPVHIRTFAGVAQTPALWREPFMFLSLHQVQASFTKLTAEETTARMYLVGAQYFPWAPEFMKRPKEHAHLTGIIRKWLNRRRYVTPFWLTTDTEVELSANAEGNYSAKIGTDGSFEMFTLAAVSTGNFELEISEPSTRQMLMNGRITQTNSVGTANFPTMLPVGYVVPAGYRLNIRIRDLSGQDNNVYLTMAGRKIYAPFKDVKQVLNETAVLHTPADNNTELVPPFVK